MRDDLPERGSERASDTSTRRRRRVTYVGPHRLAALQRLAAEGNLGALRTLAELKHAATIADEAEADQPAASDTGSETGHETSTRPLVIEDES